MTYPRTGVFNSDLVVVVCIFILEKLCKSRLDRDVEAAVPRNIQTESARPEVWLCLGGYDSGESTISEVSLGCCSIVAVVDGRRREQVIHITTRTSLDMRSGLVAIGAERIGVEAREGVAGVVVCRRSSVTSSAGIGKSSNARARSVRAAAAIAAARGVLQNTRAPIWRAHNSKVKK